MKVEELRVGNMVTLNSNSPWKELIGVPVQVIGVEQRNDKHFPDSNAVIAFRRGYATYSQFNEYIDPIPLTDDLLMVMGFSFDTNVWHNQIALYPCDEGYNYNVNFFEYDNLHTIKFVHQIQNLFYDLTGEELTIK